MTPIEKSEEQIAKDKEAVARMIGAKTAMEAAQRRIELLEQTLKSVQSRCDCVSKSFGEAAHFNVYHPQAGTWAVRSAKDIFRDINNAINAVL
ncbi:hypothetical protein [Pseudaminobacter soli (ex Li et al. 2025)]|uniref:hypothetical protein n=1 Tax=Pseudaminobacter soli (ex Li et al. 2025) TaxID=1295366 RepID=UPI001AED059D|nr:hypothetical protein [Mesorhizobium soli]